MKKPWKHYEAVSFLLAIVNRVRTPLPNREWDYASKTNFPN